MPRRKQDNQEKQDTPPWLITFSDLMTLLLTFFVLLLSLSVIDERAKRTVLGSVSQVFGLGSQVSNPLAQRAANQRHEPGPMEGNPDDLSPLRDMLFDDVEKDLDFRENKYVQIFSISDEVLFTPGSGTLGREGVLLLDRIVPYLIQMRYPLLVAGHTASRRDEEGTGYGIGGAGMDSTWPLSYNRALAVYRHLIARGIPPDNLSLEAFGQYHPRGSNDTPEGRRKNRRVDLVLDKRNQGWMEKIEELREQEPESGEHYYRGFRFDLNLPRGRDGSP